MPDTTEDELDRAIETALSGERLLAAPLTLHRRIMERVRYAALRERERVRFRVCMTALAVAFLAALGTAFLVISVTNLDVYIHHGVDGGKGQYDYLAESLAQRWTVYSGAYTFVFSLLMAGGALLLGLIPLRKMIGTH